MKSIHKMYDRAKELRHEKRFPTAYDVFHLWMSDIRRVMENIATTSLTQEDRLKREQELIEKIFDFDAKH